MLMAKDKTIKDLSYRTDKQNYSVRGFIGYSEPLAERWVAQARVSSMVSSRESIKDAKNADGTANDYYSSFSDNRYLSEGGGLILQYSNDTSTVPYRMK